MLLLLITVCSRCTHSTACISKPWQAALLFYVAPAVCMSGTYQPHRWTYLLHRLHVCLGPTNHTDGHTHCTAPAACMSGTYQPNRWAYSLHQLHAQHCAGCCEVKSDGKDSVSSLMKNYTSSLKTKNKTGIIERRLRICNL